MVSGWLGREDSNPGIAGVAYMLTATTIRLEEFVRESLPSFRARNFPFDRQEARVKSLDRHLLIFDFPR